MQCVGKEHTGPLLPIVHMPISHPEMLISHPVFLGFPGRRFWESAGTGTSWWHSWEAVIKRHVERTGRRGSQAQLQNIDFLEEGSHRQAPCSCHDQTIPEECDSHIADPRPQATASPGNLLETQILKVHLKSTKAETWGGSSNGCFHNPPLIGCVLKSKELCSEFKWTRMLLKPNPHHLQSSPNSCYCCYCYYCLLFSPSQLPPSH